LLSAAVGRVVLRWDHVEGELALELGESLLPLWTDRSPPASVICPPIGAKLEVHWMLVRPGYSGAATSLSETPGGPLVIVHRGLS
jgi:hypothetical protein